MSTQAIREYLFCIWNQYHCGDRKLKSRLLDELVRNLGIHRKAAVRLMNRPWAPRSQQGYKGGRRRHYSTMAKEQLARLWHSMGYMCAARMKAALPEWLNHYKNPQCPPSVRDELLSMSASSINRFLKDERSKVQRKLNSGTRRGVRKFVTAVPVRELDRTPEELGHCEMDCVAHCGESLSGTFAWTLTLTDIASGWTECEALWGKDGFLVQKALERIEKRLPFKLKALYCDNGVEFMNKNIVEWFSRNKREEPLPVYRGRPRRKNDQCYVEQKNYTHVRSLFGYARIDWKTGVDIMNVIYRGDWRALQNFWMPQQKLLSKHRLGAKVKRTMGKPCTPFERLMVLLPGQGAKDLLRKEKQRSNPFKLRYNQRINVRKLNRLGHQQNKSEWGKMAI